VVADLGGYRALFVCAALLAVVAAFSFSRVPSDPNAPPAAGTGRSPSAGRPHSPAEEACSQPQ
jgi:hypothetical protein